LKQLFLLLLFILSSNTFASFDNCRMRAIDSDPPRYINVCNTPEGQMRLEDYYRYLDNGLRITSNFEVIDESSFLPESEYPSRAVEIDSARLSETLGRIAELGRVSDTEEMIRARESSNRIDRINERIREINAARERLIQDRDAVIEEQEHMFRLLAQLKNPNPIVRVGTALLMRAQSSKKEFAGEFGQRHLALKNKFKSVRVEDIKSYKLVGSAGMSFLRSEEEFEGGDKSFASDLLSLSESLLDVGLGIAPGSSLVKDSYELIFGTNMVTGEELSELERGIALVGVGVGVVSFGSAGGVATTLLRSKKLVKLADHFWNVSAKFLKTSKDVFDKALVVGENIVEGAWKLGLKAKEEIQGVGRFLKNTLGNEVGAVGKIDDLLVQAGGKNLKAYSEATKELAESGVKLSKNADEFLSNQVLHGDQILGKGTSFAKGDLVRVGQKYDDLTAKMDDVVSVRIEADVWRAVPETVKDGAGNIVARNTDETVFNFHKGTKFGNGRYSQPGDSALYTSMGKKEDAWQTVMEELGDHANQDLILNSKHYKLDKVLDLTDPATLRKLGIRKTDILINKDEFQGAYEVTHQIGNIVKEKGFQGIKVPSEPNPSGVNLIIFGD
jgi:RES domain-containing protein